MKKNIFSILLFVSLLITSVQFVGASNSITTMNEIDVINVIENPEKYPNIHFNRYTADEFKEIVYNDENMSNLDKNRILNEINSNLKARGSSTLDYWTFYVTCSVTTSYSCRPYFYTYTDFNGPSHEPSAFIKILYANIDRSWNGTSKQFSGSLYYKLESSRKIFWDLNGDFYHNGSTTYSGGATIGVGNSSNVSFSVSRTESHYKYIHKNGRFTI